MFAWLVLSDHISYLKTCKYYLLTVVIFFSKNVALDIYVK